jgi:hypothetical protein
MNNNKLFIIFLCIIVAVSSFLPWISLSIYEVKGNEIEGLGIVNILCPVLIIVLLVIDGIKNQISSNIQLAISLLSAGQIVYNVYVLKQFEIKSTLLDLAKDVSDVIPFINLNGLFEVKYEAGIFIFFGSIGIILILPIVNYFVRTKN